MGIEGRLGLPPGGEVGGGGSGSSKSRQVAYPDGICQSGDVATNQVTVPSEDFPGICLPGGANRVGSQGRFLYCPPWGGICERLLAGTLGTCCKAQGHRYTRPSKGSGAGAWDVRGKL